MEILDLLTNDAKYLLASMYKAYVEKRKTSSLKKDASHFGSVDNLHHDLMSEWPVEDVLSTCYELKKHGLISGTLASGTFFRIFITTEAIAIMESRFKDRVDSILDYASKIKGLIPFF
ncbi:hypothetical protein [Enterococcus durans]|uniref:hypothetical protein n=1 Tax=Enterococcus durans TaxID=53345 RepID=UPI002073E035|nr:hypothetical protein [Enterococcus durans]